MAQKILGPAASLPADAIRKSELDVAIAGVTASNYYSALSPPQSFNPSLGAVTADTATFTVSSGNLIAIVALNGQVLDSTEYSLVSTSLTVTPAVGFFAASDEILVFQQTFASALAGFRSAYTFKTAAYTVLSSDHVVECNGVFTVTLFSGTVAGQQLIIKNSGTGTITIDGSGAETIDGAPAITLNQQYDSVTMFTNGSGWMIV